MTRIYTIGGFTETPAHETGMHRMHRAAIAPYEDRPDVQVEPVRPWKSDWRALAARARLDGVRSVIIAGYSWGAGFGAQKLAQELGEYGIPVRLMLLCDPVYRPTWLPTLGPANIFGFRALIPGWAKIAVPDNVRALTGVRQTGSIPKGHALRWRGDVIELERLPATHVTIDEHPRWQDLVRDELEMTLGKP